MTKFVYLWTYDVREGCEREFERLYGPDGDWARFFGESEHYLGTDLLRDNERKGRYVTVDRWLSEESRRVFIREHRREFETLDGKGDRLTANEARIGDFQTIGFQV